MTRTAEMAESRTPTNIHTKLPVRKPSRGALDSMTPKASPVPWRACSDVFAGAWERL
jgi:hypothetical protein